MFLSKISFNPKEVKTWQPYLLKEQPRRDWMVGYWISTENRKEILAILKKGGEYL
jgi:hypothetical protein